MIDNDGKIASHTGRCCLPEAGSFVGDTFCTQANMMLRDTVWRAMARAYEQSEGPLAERLLAALDAAQTEGGDLRGRQTAALLIVDSRPSPLPLVDLRVDHDPEPLVQLRRLWQLHQAYALEYKIVEHVDEGDTAPVGDLIAQIGQLAPDEPYLQCLCALHLDRVLGRRQEALAKLQPLVEQGQQWRIYLERELAAAQASDCPDFDPQLLRDLDQSQSNNMEKNG
jgi:hypothetical protein